MFLLYYKDFFEQICSDVQFISPPEEVGEFLLHLLKTNLRCDERKLPVRMDVSALQPDKIFDKINEAAPNNKE